MSASLLDHVRDVAGEIADGARQTDRTGRLRPEAIAALVEIGVFRMMTPAGFGGLESTPSEAFDVVRIVSRACTSTGWVAATLMVNSWQVGLFDERAQSDVWNSGPDSLVASSYQHTGQLCPHGDGYRLSGQWRFVSGLAESDWVFVGALILNQAGDPVEHGLALVPRADVEMTDATECVGLRAAANADVRMTDVPVPAYRVYRTSRRNVRASRRGNLSRSSLYRHSLASLFSTALTVPLIGAAEAAYAALIAQLQDAPTDTLTAGTGSGQERVAAAVGRCAAEIDQAVMLLDRNTRELEVIAATTRDTPVELQARARRDQVLAGELALTVVERLVRLGGRACLSTDSPVQRAWRDVHVGCSHRVNDLEPMLAVFGRSEMGRDIEEELVFL